MNVTRTNERRHVTTQTFYACDADGFPLWLKPVTQDESVQYAPHHLMPAAKYALAWLIRHDAPARWYVVPR